MRLALIAVLIACGPHRTAREPLANTAPPPNDATVAPDANPCDAFFLLAQRALECTRIDRATHDAIQSIVDGMIGAVSERGLDEDQDAPERECADGTAQTRKLAAACKL
jgi:hypothetical protein